MNNKKQGRKNPIKREKKKRRYIKTRAQRCPQRKISVLRVET